MATKSKIPSKAMQKRISKTGEVTDADVELYIKQVGMDTLQSMNLTPGNVKEYLKNIVELGQPQSKKKLPSKKKIESGDSVVVVDNSGKMSKVEPSPDRSKDEESSFKSFSRKTVEGTLDLGSKAFNKMFPTVGKIMGWVQNKIDRQTRTAAETNTSVQGYSRETQRSSRLLDSIIESQLRSNGILQQILDVVATRNAQQTAATGPRGNTPPSAQEPPASRVSGSDLTRNAAVGAALAATAIAGAGAVMASRTEPEVSAPPPPPITPPVVVPAPATPPAAVPPATTPTPATPPAPTTPAAAPPPAATPVAAAPVVPSAAPAPTPPAAAATPAGPRAELNPRQRGMVDRLLREQNLQGDESAKELAENIARRIRPSEQLSVDERILESNFTSRRIRLSPIGMLIAHQPVIPGQPLSANQMVAIERGISGNQSYPQVVLDQYNRQKGITTQAAALSTETATAAALPVPVPSAVPAAGTVIAVPTAAAVPTETTTTQPIISNARMLNIKAREIIFKADKFEYPQSAISAAGVGVSRGAAATTSSVGSWTSSIPAGASTTTPASGGAQMGAPDLTTIRTKSGKPVQVASSVSSRFQGFLNDLESTGYQIREIGGYANRPNVNNPSVMSVHASGMAIDINPAQNPNRSTTTDMPPETAQIAAKWGLGWGMNWRSVKDPMHFSAAANEGGGAPQPAAATAISAPTATGRTGNDGAPSGGTGASQVATPAAPASTQTSSSTPAASAAPSTPSSGAAVARASTADEASTRATPAAPSTGQSAAAPAGMSQSTPSSGAIDPNNPGDVEPPDAALRYARLFNMAA